MLVGLTRIRDAELTVCRDSSHSVCRTSRVTFVWCQSACCGGCVRRRRLPLWTPVWSNRSSKLCWTTPRTRTPASERRASTRSSACCGCAREKTAYRSVITRWCALPCTLKKSFFAVNYPNVCKKSMFCHGR